MTFPSRAGADMRLLRAAVFSTVCVALSAAGHSIASGGGIPAWALLAGWGGMLGVAVPLAGKERSLPGIAGVLLGGELGLHLMFALGQCCAPAARSVGHNGIDHAATMTGMADMPGMANMPGMAGAAEMTSQAGHPAHALPASMTFSPAMLVGHIAAAIALGWMLRCGEAALWRIVRLAALTAAQVAARLPLGSALSALRALTLTVGLFDERPPAACPGDAGDRLGRLESRTLQHSVIRRGPPGFALAA
jgi:hypothetical protein